MKKRKEKKHFENEQQMLNHLLSIEKGKDFSKIAIVSGHYMLMYSKNQDRLIPMIRENLTGLEKEYSNLYAGGFPLRTLKHGISLAKELDKANLQNDLVFVVNDHWFQRQSKNAQKLDCAKLRKDYFDSNTIPKAFSELIDEKVSVLKNHKKRSSQEILPSDSYFFSEQVFRNRFDNHGRKRLLKNESFFAKQDLSTSNLYFKPPGGHNKVCLTEGGMCDCSGEVIEFLLELFRRSFDRIIFFAPNECDIPVNNGTIAALHLDESTIERRVDVITGLGGKGESEAGFNNLTPITVTSHNTVTNF